MAKSDSKTVNPEKSSQASDKKVDEGKLKALGLAMDQITKQFGDGSIMKLGEAHKVDVEVIPSGALSLDLALGGGYPKGRIIEIYGPESSGKTTLTLHAIAEIQKQGGTAALLTPSTRLIQHTLSVWVWTRKTCWFLSQITVSKHWNYRDVGFVRTRWIW